MNVTIKTGQFLIRGKIFFIKLSLFERNVTIGTFTFYVAPQPVIFGSIKTSGAQGLASGFHAYND